MEIKYLTNLKKDLKKNKQVKWAVITLLIGILTIVAVLSQSKDLTFGDLMKLMALARKAGLKHVQVAERRE